MWNAPLYRDAYYLLNEHYYSGVRVNRGPAMKTIAQINYGCNPVMRAIESTFISCFIPFLQLFTAIACKNIPFLDPPASVRITPLFSLSSIEKFAGLEQQLKVFKMWIFENKLLYWEYPGLNHRNGAGSGTGCFEIIMGSA